MDRYDLFLSYYRLLNDYVTLYELLFAKNKSFMYLKFTNVHKHIMVSGKNMPNDTFEMFVKAQTESLLVSYFKMINDYFSACCPPALFRRYRSNNPDIAATYETITSHIGAVSTGNVLDVGQIVANIRIIEQNMQYFTPWPAMKAQDKPN